MKTIHKLLALALCLALLCGAVSATMRETGTSAVSYTHLRAHETGRNLVCRLLLEKKKTPSPQDRQTSRMPSSACKKRKQLESQQH